jgi:8-oxo-dGTP pyrophosphatase MutT (NUDIX family)
MTDAWTAEARPVGAAVVADGHVLLVDGEDGWDLPGGLAGLSESDVDAAIRLLHEETGIDLELIRHLDAVLYAGPADDPRVAATLQVTTTLTVFRLNHLPAVAGPARTGWFPVHSLNELCAALRTVGGAVSSVLLPLLEIVLRLLGGQR